MTYGPTVVVIKYTRYNTSNLKAIKQLVEHTGNSVTRITPASLLRLELNRLTKIELHQTEKPKIPKFFESSRF